ncbi:TPA: hypothetical protein I7212_14325 [Vibrio vulnificus]|nr:hypothetical protein [Vibrio vulnificus]
MEHKAYFTRTVLDEMKKLERDVIDSVYKHFVQPINFNGLTPPDELRGKYKPSWKMKTPEHKRTAFQNTFLEDAENKRQYHYHFGYKMYSGGKDPEFPGDESAGILHTRIDVSKAVTEHVILEVCLKHPSPFKYPFFRADDLAVRS